MTQPAGLASLNPSTGTVLYGRGQLGSIRLKTSRLPAFSFLAVLILCPEGTAVVPSIITDNFYSIDHCISYLILEYWWQSAQLGHDSWHMGLGILRKKYASVANTAHFIKIPS